MTKTKTTSTKKPKAARRPAKKTAKKKRAPAKPAKPTSEQWEGFARLCWLEAQALAEIAGEEEELFESIGRSAIHLGLSWTLDFIPDDAEDRADILRSRGETPADQPATESGSPAELAAEPPAEPAPGLSSSHLHHTGYSFGTPGNDSEDES